MENTEDYDVVKSVVEKSFKTGVSAKTGKEWALHKYMSNSGKEFSSFDELEPGDTVKLTQNDYGWNGARPRKTDTQHDEVMAALRKIYDLLNKQGKDVPPEEPSW